MNIDELTIGQAKELAALFDKAERVSAPQRSRYEGKGEAVIVRAKDAGVHYGHLVAYEGRMVWLKDARRMWKWKAAGGVSLSGCAVYGIVQSESRIEAIVSTQIVLDACEIIFCNTLAAGTIEEAP